MNLGSAFDKFKKMKMKTLYQINNLSVKLKQQAFNQTTTAVAGRILIFFKDFSLSLASFFSCLFICLSR